MSDPRRLLSEGATDFEKELLRSWDDGTRPSPSARAKALALAGVGVGAAATAASTTAAATKAGAAAAGGSIAPKAATIGTAVILKWLALGTITIAATATVGTGVYLTRPASSPVPVVKPVPPAATAPPYGTGAAPAPPSPDVTGVPPQTAPPLALAPTAQRSPAPTSSANARAPSMALGEQVSELDRARSALAQGDSNEAQRLVDDYERRFKGGTLTQEAEVVRIQALAAQGDRAGASAAAARFLAAHPSSPHAGVVRGLVSEPSPRR